jgi:hypothetical protein
MYLFVVIIDLLPKPFPKVYRHLDQELVKACIGRSWDVVDNGRDRV